MQKIGDETPERAVPVDVRASLNIMCSTRMTDEDSGEDFIRLSTVLGGDEGRMFNTLLDSVRLHCYSSSYRFTRLLHHWSPQPGQQSVLQLMTSYLNIMEKAMGAPFNLRSTTEQFKEFFQKVPQTSQQSFSLASGLSKAVEAKVDFAGFRAAVSTYMQEFLAHTPSQPIQPVGSLYPVQQRSEKRRSEPIFRILPSQPASNPPLAQPRIKIVNSPHQQPVDSLPSRSTSSEESSPTIAGSFTQPRAACMEHASFRSYAGGSTVPEWEETSILVPIRGRQIWWSRPQRDGEEHLSDAPW